MGLRLVTPPFSEPIHLDEAKKHLRVDILEDDKLILALIRAARDIVEGFTHRALVLQTFDQVLDKFPAQINLMRSPLRKLVSIIYTDTDGISQTLSASKYEIDDKSEPARLHAAYGEVWPSSRDTLNAVTVRFQAGHVVPFTVDMTTNVLTAKGHPYINTDVVRVSNSGDILPGGLAASTDYYVIGVSGDTLQLSLSLGGAAVDITSTGAGTHFIGELPDSIHHAMLLIVGELYQRRESALVGANITSVPYSAEALLWPYRVFGDAF